MADDKIRRLEKERDALLKVADELRQEVQNLLAQIRQQEMEIKYLRSIKADLQ